MLLMVSPKTMPDQGRSPVLESRRRLRESSRGSPAHLSPGSVTLGLGMAA